MSDGGFRFGLARSAKAISAVRRLAAAAVDQTVRFGAVADARVSSPAAMIVASAFPTATVRTTI
jgi:hypothetical protein